MSTYSLSHLSDRALLRSLSAIVTQDCATTATLLAHLAEVDARRLYLPAGYPSMFEYCVTELHMSEDSACRRIRAARAGRQFPALFAALAAGRLHLTAVLMLAPHLTPETVDELLTAAAHKKKSQLEQLLAQRFPRPDVPALVQALSSSPDLSAGNLSPGTVGLSAPARIESPAAPPKVAPLAPERFVLQVTIGKDTHELLRYAQALLSHSIPSGDVARVLHRALHDLVGQLERRKFGATAKPRPLPRHASANERYVPAHVRRAVWERDQGQCTFVGDTGHRCAARKLLEFDHLDPVARGGQATAARMQLRCRSHNQYGAECTFGREFMENKRQAARLAARARAAKAAAAAERAKEQDVVPWLRRLGFRADESRCAAELCEAVPNASLEERVRVALSYFHSRASSHVSRAVNRPGDGRVSHMGAFI